ncbi:MAG: response regulator [Holosporales bacterium]
MVIKVLYIDDNDSDLFFMELCMRNLGNKAQLLTFNNGRSFSDFVNREHEYLHRPDMGGPHCIILDLHMSDMDGFQILTQLKNSAQQNLRDIPVFMISSLGSPLDRKKSHALGAVDLVRKPLAVADMEEVLANILRHVLDQKNTIPAFI